jgi:hypothetical protein
LHTVLREPNSDQQALMRQLDELSNRFIVMADGGKNFLEQIYGVAPEKVDQGAESSLAFHLALAEMTRAEAVLAREIKRSGTT